MGCGQPVTNPTHRPLLLRPRGGDRGHRLGRHRRLRAAVAETYHSAAPPSALSRCLNSDGEIGRQQHDSLVNGFGMQMAVDDMFALALIIGMERGRQQNDSFSSTATCALFGMEISMFAT